jgi:hypothetical protein
MAPRALVAATVFLLALASGASARAVATVRDSVDDQVDALVRHWIDQPGEPTELEDALVRLGGRAVARIAWTARQREESLPVEPLARALARLGAIDALAALTDSDQPSERAAGTRALALLPTAESVAKLVAAIDDESDDVAAAAADALAELLAARPELVDRTHVVGELRNCRRRDDAADALARIDTQSAHAALVAMVASHDDAARSAGLTALWRVGTLEDAAAVRALLRRSNPVELRKKASLVLGRMKDEEAVPELVDELEESDEGLVRDAHWALCATTGQHLARRRELWASWWSSHTSTTSSSDERGSPSSSERESTDGPLAGATDTPGRASHDDDSSSHLGTGLVVILGFFGATAAALFVVSRRVVPRAERGGFGRRRKELAHAATRAFLERAAARRDEVEVG